MGRETFLRLVGIKRPMDGRLTAAERGWLTASWCIRRKIPGCWTGVTRLFLAWQRCLQLSVCVTDPCHFPRGRKDAVRRRPWLLVCLFTEQPRHTYLYMYRRRLLLWLSSYSVLYRFFPQSLYLQRFFRDSSRCGSFLLPSSLCLLNMDRLAMLRTTGPLTLICTPTTCS